jgi:hypothetical protein
VIKIDSRVFPEHLLEMKCELLKDMKYPSALCSPLSAHHSLLSTLCSVLGAHHSLLSTLCSVLGALPSLPSYVHYSTMTSSLLYSVRFEHDFSWNEELSFEKNVTL